MPCDLLISFLPYWASTPFPELPTGGRGFIATDLASRQIAGHPEIYAAGNPFHPGLPWKGMEAGRMLFERFLHAPDAMNEGVERSSLAIVSNRADPDAYLRVARHFQNHQLGN